MALAAPPLDSFIEVLSVSVARALALENDAVWFVPLYAAEYDLSAGALARLPLPSAGTDEPVGLVLRTDAQPSPVARTLIDAVRDIARSRFGETRERGRHARRASRLVATIEPAARPPFPAAGLAIRSVAGGGCLAYRTDFGTIGVRTMTRQQIQVTLGVRFFQTARGNEPVREWLKALGQAERRAIGEEIKTVQLWLAARHAAGSKMAQDLWEIRVMLPGRSARVLFTVVGDTMVLLHGFFKQSRATPSDDLDVTVARLKALMRAI